MKKLCINISLFFMLLTLSSCNDWLDEVKQTTTVSDEIIWQDETQVDKYVNSFYPLLHVVRLPRTEVLGSSRPG